MTGWYWSTDKRLTVDQCVKKASNLASRATGSRRFAVLVGMSNATMNTLMAAGLMTELDYMTADESARALALETELVADAKAGVDLRVRLIGEAVSK